MAGRISGLGMGPRQPVQQDMPLQWLIDDEMERQRHEEQRRLAATSTHQPQTFGPIAGPPGRASSKQPLFGSTSSKQSETAALARKSRKIEKGKQAEDDRQRQARYDEAKRLHGPKATIDQRGHVVNMDTGLPIRDLTDTDRAIQSVVGPNAMEGLFRFGEVAQQVPNYLPGVGDALDLTYSAYGAMEEAMQGDWLGAAGYVGLGGATLLPGMFIGPMAKNYPFDAEDAARRMLREGADADTVYRQTGIYFDGAGNPWFEKPSKLDLTPRGQQAAKGRMLDPRAQPMELTSAVTGDLFDEYPGAMNDWKARFAEDGGVAGSFSPPHQGQAASVEAFGPRSGTSKDGFAPPTLGRVMRHELEGHGAAYIEGAPGGAMPGFVPDAVRTEMPDISEHQRYLRNSGEGFARLADSRGDWTMEQMRAQSPYYAGGGVPGTEDFPRGQQWFQDPADGRLYYAFDPNDPTSMTPIGKGDLYYGGASAMAVEPDVPQSGPRRRRAISGLDKTDAELLREAIETPRKLNRAGDYVGAPPGINTPEAEQALVDDLVGRIRGYTGQGEVFYDESQGTIRNWTDSPVMARRFVSSSGHTSNMMSPLPNTNYAIKGMNQYAVGDDINTGMFSTMQSPKVRESFDTDTLSADPKTGPYSYAMLPPEYRPADFDEHVRLRGEGRKLKGGAVHDTWDKEAFRYPRNAQGKQDAASDTEHLFMDRIYNKVASIIGRDPELRARYGTGQVARERIQAALWDMERQAAEKFDVLPFSEILDQTSGFTQMAAMPGPSTGIDPSFLNMPLDMKRLYTDDMFNAFSTPDGANVAARALGFSPPMREGFGPWNGMMEPNRTIDFAVATDGLGGDKAINPSSAKAAETMRNWNQFTFGQEGSGFTQPSAPPKLDAKGKVTYPDGATKSASNLATIDLPMQTPEQFDRAFKAVEQVFGPQWADHVVVQQDRTGRLILKNLGEGDQTEFHGAMRELNKILGGGEVGRRRDLGNDFTYRRFDDPSYRTLMDETRNNPVLKKTFDEKVLPYYPRVQQASEDWAARMGLPANTVPDRVRRIFIEAGERWPEAMDEAVRKGIIPAIAATAVYEGLYGQFTEGEGGWQ